MILPPLLLLALLAMVAVPTFVWMELHGGNTIDTVVMEERAAPSGISVGVDRPVLTSGQVAADGNSDECAGRFVLWVEVTLLVTRCPSAEINAS